jgi:hypothetical protein
MKKKILILAFILLLGGNIIMNAIQIYQRNEANTEWVEEYPITTSDNVKVGDSNLTDVLNSIGDASPRGTYATLAALQTAYPAGATGIYVVTADGKWYYWSGSAWTSGGAYQTPLGIVQNTGASTTNVMSQDIATKMLNTPFTYYKPELAGILDIKIYSSIYKQFGIKLFYHNANGFGAYIQIVRWNGSAYVNYAIYEKAASPALGVELISVQDKFDILIDWSLIADPLTYNSIVEIKNSCVYPSPRISKDGYAVKDSISTIITVDANGNGDYTTIAAAYA